MDSANQTGLRRDNERSPRSEHYLDHLAIVASNLSPDEALDIGLRVTCARLKTTNSAKIGQFVAVPSTTPIPEPYDRLLGITLNVSENGVDSKQLA